MADVSYVFAESSDFPRRNNWHGPCDSAGTAQIVSAVFARQCKSLLWNKWCCSVPKAAAHRCSASGRHMFFLISIVVMGYVKLSTPPCPASLGTDNIHLFQRQLELEAKPVTSCQRCDEVCHVASTHWIAAQRGWRADRTSQVLPGVVWKSQRWTPCWKRLVPIFFSYLSSPALPSTPSQAKTKENNHRIMGC